jgi:hypothetical protein
MIHIRVKKNKNMKNKKIQLKIKNLMNFIILKIKIINQYLIT